MRSSPLRWLLWICLPALLLLAACGGNKLYLNQTFQFKLDPIPVSQDKTISLQAGEVIDLTPILEAEGWAQNVVVTRKYNNYFLAADGWRHLYMIRPGKKEEAKYKAIDPTPDNEVDVIKNPSFDPRQGDCVQFFWTGDKGPVTTYLDDSGDLTDAKCLTVVPEK